MRWFIRDFLSKQGAGFRFAYARARSRARARERSQLADHTEQLRAALGQSFKKIEGALPDEAAASENLNWLKGYADTVLSERTCGQSPEKDGLIALVHQAQRYVRALPSIQQDVREEIEDVVCWRDFIKRDEEHVEWVRARRQSGDESWSEESAVTMLVKTQAMLEDIIVQAAKYQAQEEQCKRRLLDLIVEFKKKARPQDESDLLGREL